uniref:Uncharacterized protein n=1 Tax=Heterorhabditis bacteriophora TaxID=37862 RepID=A0A1I7WZR3_HETBA
MAPSSFSDGSRHSRHVTTALATPRRAKKSCHSQLITISYKGSDGHISPE